MFHSTLINLTCGTTGQDFAKNIQQLRFAMVQMGASPIRSFTLNLPYPSYAPCIRVWGILWKILWKVTLGRRNLFCLSYGESETRQRYSWVKINPRQCYCKFWIFETWITSFIVSFFLGLFVCLCCPFRNENQSQAVIAAKTDGGAQPWSCRWCPMWRSRRWPPLYWAFCLDRQG